MKICYTGKGKERNDDIIYAFLLQVSIYLTNFLFFLQIHQAQV